MKTVLVILVYAILSAVGMSYYENMAYNYFIKIFYLFLLVTPLTFVYQELAILRNMARIKLRKSYINYNPKQKLKFYLLILGILLILYMFSARLMLEKGSLILAVFILIFNYLTTLSPELILLKDKLIYKGGINIEINKNDIVNINQTESGLRVKSIKKDITIYCQPITDKDYAEIINWCGFRMK